MSAPQTNVEKQAKRHSPALIGMAVAAVVAVAALAWWAWYARDRAYQAETIDALDTDATADAVGEPPPSTDTAGTEAPPPD